MIKLSNIPEDVMDVVMSVARETNTRPDAVIKSMLSLVDFEEAKRAVYEEEKGYKNPTRN